MSSFAVFFSFWWISSLAVLKVVIWQLLVQPVMTFHLNGNMYISVYNMKIVFKCAQLDVP